MAMLATPSPFYNPPFLPSRPSPLSPRSANVFSPLTPVAFTFGMTGSENQESKAQTFIPYSQRAVRANPFANRNADEQRERRRNMFLRRVEQAREDKRWQGRTDQILRSDYLAEQERWSERQAQLAQQHAMDLSTSPPEFEDAMMIGSESNLDQFSIKEAPREQQESIMQEVENIAHQEQMELEALVDLADQDPEQLPDRFDSANYDDGDYDSLFMEFIADEATSIPLGGENHYMDVS